MKVKEKEEVEVYTQLMFLAIDPVVQIILKYLHSQTSDPTPVLK